MLIANKADLPPARHAVTQQEGADWAAHNHCTFFQIAAVRVEHVLAELSAEGLRLAVQHCLCHSSCCTCLRAPAL